MPLLSCSIVCVCFHRSSNILKTLLDNDKPIRSTPDTDEREEHYRIKWEGYTVPFGTMLENMRLSQRHV